MTNPLDDAVINRLAGDIAYHVAERKSAVAITEEVLVAFKQLRAERDEARKNLDATQAERSRMDKSMQQDANRIAELQSALATRTRERDEARANAECWKIVVSEWERKYGYMDGSQKP